MMEENEFNEIGKRMPYKAPAGFFDNITNDTLAQAEKRAEGKKKQLFIWRTMSVAASIVVLLVAGYVLFPNRINEKEMLTQAPVNENKIAHTANIPPADKLEPEPMDSQKLSTQTPGPARPILKKIRRTKKVKPAQVAVAPETETLEDILENISDEELLQLAALAETELSVYEEADSDE